MKVLRPLSAYLFVTIGLPWLNGAGADPGFAHHAGMVVTGAVGLAVVWQGALSAWAAARSPR